MKKLFYIGLTVLTMSLNAKGQNKMETRNMELVNGSIVRNEDVADIMMIERVITLTGMYSDFGMFDEQLKLWDDEITIDFGDVKPPQVMKATDLVSWAKVAYKNIKDQHMFFNFIVNVKGDTANSVCYGRALHEQKETGDKWLIYIRYEHSFRRKGNGWVMTRLKMEPTFQEGNSDLIDQEYEKNSKVK